MSDRATTTVRSSRSRGVGAGRVIGACGAGAVLFVVLLWLQLSGVLSGWPLLAFGVLAALLVPSSRELSRRVLLVGCIALGAAPVAWWFPFPFAGLTHFGLCAALLPAFLAAFLLTRRVTLQALVPRFRFADALTAGALVSAIWMYMPLLAASTGETAMRILRQGWDYAAHFNMTDMVRRSGSLTELATPGPFGEWSSSDYPKGFHSTAATIMEVTIGAQVAGADAELVGFLHATAALAIAAVTMVAAGLASLPQLRASPLIAVPLVALVTLAFLLGPGGGGDLIRYGFPNFMVAVALLACMPLVVIPLERIGPVAPLLALAGILIGVAHNWALLLVLALAGLIPAILPARRRRWPIAMREWVVLGAVCAMTIVAGAAAWWTLTRGIAGTGTATLLTTPGGFIGGSLIEVVLPAALAIVVCAAIWWGFVRSGARTPSRSGPVVRAAALIFLPVVGLAAMAGVAALQLSSTGELSYYFYKLGAGVQLISVVLAAAALAVLIPLARRAARRGLLIAAALAVTALVATSSGVVNPTSESVAIRRPPGSEAHQTWLRIVSTPADENDAESLAVIRAADVVTAEKPHFWVPAELDGSTAPRLSNQWLFALTGQWAVSSAEVIGPLWGDSVPVTERPKRPEDAVSEIQAQSPEGIIVVTPELLQRLEGAKDVDPERLGTW